MRPKATSKRLEENERVIVTEWRFAPGAETGWHRHAHDYVVVCLTDGKLVENFGNEKLNWTAYKVGERTLFARSDEFGYANYEVIPAPDTLVDLNKAKRR